MYCLWEIPTGNARGEGMKRKHRIFVAAGVFLLLVFLVCLVFLKKIKINSWFANRYDIQGIDISHYQGKIDWEKMQEQDVDFVFIKATEGSAHVDECFYDSWKGACQTDLYVGAYHFFSFDSEAETQAELYINTVGELSGRLAPVVDVEYYGDKENNPPDKKEAAGQLSRLLAILEERYHTKPVIYTTYKVYHRYIRDEFEDYPLWIRNVYYPPDIDIGKEWTLWQYTDTAVMDGYDGDEKYIDRNVFYGDREALKKLIVE